MSQNKRIGFTLLETLLVLSLMIFIMGTIWGMMRLYSSNYLATEKRISRSQLVRSIAEMLRDDLDAAIQDPIHPLLEKAEGSAPIRRFGLRGTAQSLQFDVVQNTPFILSDHPLSTEKEKQKKGQAPELKTIFYVFIPPYVREKKRMLDESSEGSFDPISGSQIIGSLQNLPENRENHPQEMEPLVRKYGLSRRELDFETLFSEKKTDINLIVDDSKWLEAKDLVMEQADGVDWAPEVLDCRFEYFDGSSWIDHWDSIEKGGLPVAIGVSLKLFSLDEVEQLRTHPFFIRWSEEMVRMKDLAASEDPGGSRIVGSLTETDRNTISLSTGVLPDLQDIIKRIGLSDPMERQVISWIPTTSLKSHMIMERRKPIAIQEGKGKGRSFNAFESVDEYPKREQLQERDSQNVSANLFSFKERRVKDRIYQQNELNQQNIFSSISRDDETKNSPLPLEDYRPAQKEGATTGQSWIRGK